MSREENIAVVEAFLDCVVRKEIERLPIDPEITFESPLIPETKGHVEAVRYLRMVAATVQSIRVLQHVVEGDHVATLFEEMTVNGPLRVFAKFEIAAGRIRDARVFYDPRRVAS